MAAEKRAKTEAAALRAVLQDPPDLVQQLGDLLIWSIGRRAGNFHWLAERFDRALVVTASDGAPANAEAATRARGVGRLVHVGGEHPEVCVHFHECAVVLKQAAWKPVPLARARQLLAVLALEPPETRTPAIPVFVLSDKRFSFVGGGWEPGPGAELRYAVHDVEEKPLPARELAGLSLAALLGGHTPPTGDVRVTYRYDLHAGAVRRASEYGNAGLLEPPACSLLVAFDAPAEKPALQQPDQVRHFDTIMALCGQRERLDLLHRLAEARHAPGDVTFDPAEKSGGPALTTDVAAQAAVAALLTEDSEQPLLERFWALVTCCDSLSRMQVLLLALLRELPVQDVIPAVAGTSELARVVTATAAVIKARRFGLLDQVEGELRAQEEAFSKFHGDLSVAAGALADLGLEVLREQAMRHLTAHDLCSRTDLESAVARRGRRASASRRSSLGARRVSGEEPVADAVDEVQLLCNLVEVSQLAQQFGLPADATRSVVQMAQRAEGVYLVRLGRWDASQLLANLKMVPHAVDASAEGTVARWRYGQLQVLRSRGFPPSGPAACGA